MRRVSEQFSPNVIDALGGPDRPREKPKTVRKPKEPPPPDPRRKDGETLEMFLVDEEGELPKVTRAEGLVLHALRDQGSLAWDELTRHTGLKSQTVSPRLKPLRLRGLIEDSGERFGGHSGARQVRWKLTELGKRVVTGLQQWRPDKTLAQHPAAVTTAMVDALTLEDYELILGKGGMKLHGWLKKRMKRAIRLITEGVIYDDPGEDGAKTPRQIPARMPHTRRERIAAMRNKEARRV